MTERVNLRAFKDAAARAAHGMTVAEAHAAGVCLRCRKPPTFYSEAGRREYRISGLCEPCFDALVLPPDE